jgi:hypothetical protein
MPKLCFVICTFLLLSCKDSGVNNQNQSNDKIIYEVEYVNYSWGFNYHGTMIDQDGSIYSYNPAKDTISVLYHAEYYTEQELQSKYQHAKTYINKIAEDSLNWSHNLATEVTNNDFSDTSRLGADMGELEYSIYIYRPQMSRYQKIILKVEGDWTFYNKSQYAISLVTWLKKLLLMPNYAKS